MVAANPTVQTALVRGTLNGSLARDLMLGPFIVAFAVQVLHYSNAQVSWYLSLLPLFVLLRYPFLHRISHIPRITVTRWSRLIQLSCMVRLLVLPQGWLTVPVLLALAVWFVFGNEFLQNAVWMNLVTEVTTPGDRGRFLGRLRTWKQATNMTFALIGFVLVGDALSRGEHRILVLIVIALLINSLWWYRHVPATPPVGADTPPVGKGQFWGILRHHPLLRRPLLLTFVIDVLSWPILIVYLVGTLHLPANLLMLTTAAAMLGSILSEYLWGAAVDRRGVRRIFQIYFIGSLALLPLLLMLPDYALIEPFGAAWITGTAALMGYFLLTGILAAGQAMAISVYRAQYLDQAQGFFALNILTAANQLFKAVLTGLGGIALIILPAKGGGSFVTVTIAVMLLAILAGLWIARHLPAHTSHAGQNHRNPLDSDPIGEIAHGEYRANR